MKSMFSYVAAGALMAAVISVSFGQTAPVSPTMPPSPHGAMGGAATMPGLPTGHPSLDDLMGAGDNAGEIPGMGPTTLPKIMGSLDVKVVAGTAGDTVAPNEPVTVTLYHRGSPVKKFDLTVDAAGKVLIPEFQVMPPVQALVSVKHAGLEQPHVSPELNPQEPKQAIEVKVFQTTEQQPAWNIAMQHMIVQWAEDGSGARIVQMMSTTTPGDRIWLGDKVGDKRVTLSIPLPPQVDDVELASGFDEELSKIADGKLVTGGPLYPGRSEYRIVYTIPAKNGTLELPITTPAAVTNLIVFVPADDVQVTATGLTGGQPIDMGQGPIRMYRAQNLPAGAVATLSIKGIKPAAADADAAAAPEIKPAGISGKSIAMGAAFLIALVGAGMIFIKKQSPKKT